MYVFAKLTVCRQQGGEGDTSQSDLDFHRLRAKAMHDVLDNDPTFDFQNWEQADDERPHEWAEVWGWVGEWGAEFTTVAVPALQYIGSAMLQAGVGSAGVAGIVKLFKRFREKQIKGECRDVKLYVENKTEILLHPDQGQITISIGCPVSFSYDASDSEIKELGTEGSELIKVPADLVPFVRSLIEEQKTE